MSSTEQPVNVWYFKQTAYGEGRCRETGWGYDKGEDWTVNLIRCFPCAHKSSHACSKADGGVLKVKVGNGYLRSSQFLGELLDFLLLLD